jgi:hypothetical protein
MGVGLSVGPRAEPMKGIGGKASAQAAANCAARTGKY